MAVSARSAKVVPFPANLEVGQVDMRKGTPVRAGSFPYEGPDLDTGWHTHDLHQIEYAFQGVAEVETKAAHYLLPPQQAVWIPAGLAHRTTLKKVRSASVFFAPEMVGEAGDRARVLAAAPVIREMIIHATRWPITRPASDPIADAFFEALALLVEDSLEHEMPLCLPTSTDPAVAAVMAYTQSHLAAVTLHDVCRATGMSERTLRRRFSAATAMSWRQYLIQSRVLRAMSLLADPGPGVLEVAARVGFESGSAFARTFRELTGSTPDGYRRRVRVRLES